MISATMLIIIILDVTNDFSIVTIVQIVVVIIVCMNCIPTDVSLTLTPLLCTVFDNTNYSYYYYFYL
jgi:hypothetical protein